MSVFDYNEMEVPEGLLEIDSTVAETNASQLRLEMFADVLVKARGVTVPSSRMMGNIIKDVTEEPNDSYNRCHVKSHARTPIGGGFKNSYQKNC